MPPIEDFMLQWGPIGMFLGWFMWKFEPWSKRIEAKMDRQAKAILIWTISSPTSHPAAKQEARDLIDEIERESKR